MTLPEFGLFLISILASVAGQWLLKAGALKLGRVDASNFVSHVLGMITIPELLAGLTCYALGAIVYILVLTRVKLSVAGPAVALVYVFSLLIGYFIFREAIPTSRLVGLGLIICGVILVIWKS
ncbi:EamA family transporter [Chroogloeocystis siderophila]|uniref:EamA-like transporter family protein n=1 Tax=Chroogloeocystis siderophila 5.2 s.c.1 TaxID=247279 RepID=A0A1U7HP41_9CHRO|nr:EamA family transporter [Chroogloeocystis siderophila]OKH25331.1 EamA-like transporter family protein [Chroogloeocystis siderophila 5.2 s.c.1]